MWKREVDGKVLTFRLAGINNQNFLMRDEETGSYWQQISGKAISGPLKGKQLELIHSDELTFTQWKAEHPEGTLLKDVDAFASQYAPQNWDVRMASVPVVVDTKSTGVAPRDLVLGVTVGSKARAYRVQDVLRAKLVQDRIGELPLFVVVGPDDRSIRVFEARVKSGHEVETSDFYRDVAGGATSDLTRPILRDASTGSTWNFKGCAVDGPAKGQCLRPVYAIRDYWFDWHLYHPDTTLFGSQK